MRGTRLRCVTLALSLGLVIAVSSVSAPNGPFTSLIPFRYSYVFNGIALTLPLFNAIDDVLAVLPNEPMVMHLDRAVDYTRAGLLGINRKVILSLESVIKGSLQEPGFAAASVGGARSQRKIKLTLPFVADHGTRTIGLASVL